MHSCLKFKFLFKIIKRGVMANRQQSGRYPATYHIFPDSPDINLRVYFT